MNSVILSNVFCLSLPLRPGEGVASCPSMEESSANRRLTIPEYAMTLAHVASLRSEDPFRKVGAVAIDFDNRVIGTAYNGLAPGYNADPDFWEDRDSRRKYMLHAEVNLCSLFTRGNVKLVACTTMPCTSCMQMLCSYGVREVYYHEVYPTSEAEAICSRYGIHLEQMLHYPQVIAPIMTGTPVIPNP